MVQLSHPYMTAGKTITLTRWTFAGKATNMLSRFIFNMLYTAAAAKALQLCPTLCDPTDGSPPGSPAPGILQARTLMWMSMTSTRESSWPRDQIHISYVSCIGRWVLYHWATREALCKVSNFTNDSTCKEWGAQELVSKVPENRVFLSFLVIYDCSHKIKRFLLLGRKATTNLDSVLKTRDITLLTKVCLVKVMVFPVVMYGCERWTIKKAECWRIDTFQMWCWRWLLIDPWTAKRSNQLCKV